MSTLLARAAAEPVAPGPIPFNRPTVTGGERRYLDKVFERGEFAGAGAFSRRCHRWLEKRFGVPVLMTASCTDALEMAALLCDLAPGDEVILPSFAFSSTATAFLRCGASLVFADVDPVTMNLDPAAVAAAVSDRTRVIVVLHYAGVACDMKPLGELAREHGFFVVEDAAQAIFSRYRGVPCGTLGTFGCFSFHETKNLQCGEGGALLVNHPDYVQRAEILWEKGTDRSRFLRGEVDKYTWQDTGSSFVLSELNAAFLLPQLESGDRITADRLESWREYERLLRPLADDGLIEIPSPPDDCEHNGHIFWVKARSAAEQKKLIRFLKQQSIQSFFHYVPLHSAPAGRRFGRFSGDDRFTTSHSSRLLRLPLFYGFRETARVAQAVAAFYGVSPSS